MCRSTLHAFLQRLPKCEQHMHLEGSLLPATLFELAKRNNIQLPSEDSAYASEEALVARYEQFSSLDDFLGYYYRGMSVLITKQDFEDLTYAYLKRAHEEGVMHAEMSFDPQAHLERVPFHVPIEGIEAGRRRAEQEFGISTALIMCFLRHLGQLPALELFRDEAVQTYLRNGAITGIGLDSSENGYPPELFRDVFSMANALGLSLTAHAGEEGPSENIRKALDVLGCQRIDHGLRLTEDAELVKRVSAQQILLTLCPLSNVYLRCLGEVAHAPIKDFLAAGVPFSINSDDPAYLGGFIMDNYCAVQEAFELGVRDWQQICKNSITHSWCSSQRKGEMLDRLARVVGDHS